MKIIDSLFRKLELQMLMNLTARALDKPVKRIWTLPNSKALQVYAEYTCEHLACSKNWTLMQQMNDEAYRVGKRLRKIFHLRKPTDITFLAVSEYWYSNGRQHSWEDLCNGMLFQSSLYPRYLSGCFGFRRWHY